MHSCNWEKKKKKKAGRAGASVPSPCVSCNLFLSEQSPPTLIHLFIASVALLWNSDILLQPGGGGVARSWNHCDY